MRKTRKINFPFSRALNIFPIVISAFAFTLSISCYLYISFFLSPLNEEEWLPKERNFIVGVKDGEIFFNSEEKPRNTARELGIRRDGERRRELTLGFIERDLPPKLLFVVGDWKIPLLGWGHVGPVSLVLMRAWTHLVEITGMEKHLRNPVIFRVLNLTILIFVYPTLLTLTFLKFFRYKYGSISVLFFFYVFFLSFPINIFFIPSATLWYLIMALLTPISFMFLVSGRFGIFFAVSAFIISTHMRGAVIFISQVIYYLLTERKKDFLASLLKFSPLIFFSFVFYIIPEFVRDVGGDSNLTLFDLGGRGAISFSDILRIFLSKLAENLPLIFQFVFMRIGDLFISGNLLSLLRELGIIFREDTILYLLSVLATLLYFVPALFFSPEDKKIYLNMYIFLAVYFVLSVFAVPFFVGMPWQFIPVHFVPLFLSLRTLAVRGMRSVLPVLPAFFGVLLSSVGCLKMEGLVSPFALWSEHRKVGEVMEKTVPEKKIICVVKSDIFFLFRDCDKAKFIFLHGFSLEIATHNTKMFGAEKSISSLFESYDYVVLSYHFFWLSEFLLPRYEYEYRSDAFWILRKKTLQNFSSSDD